MHCRQPTLIRGTIGLSSPDPAGGVAGRQQWIPRTLQSRERALSNVNSDHTKSDEFHAQDAARTGPHLRWELQQVMSRVRPEDLSAAEISGLLAILVPAHSRIIGGPTGRPMLRALGIPGEDAAP